MKDSFNELYYVKKYPDVIISGISPKLHYETIGKRIGRSAYPEQKDTTEYKKNFAEEIKKWIKEGKPSSIITEKELIDKLNKISADKIILSITHDNYNVNTGGIQLIAKSEEDCCIRQKNVYLNAHPWQPLPTLAEEGSDPFLNISINGSEVGTILTSKLFGIFKKPNGYNLSIIIHHTLGHSPEDISELIKQNQNSKVLFWIHDYFSLCVNYTLVNDSNVFCNIPEVNSNECINCTFGEYRQKHLLRINKIINCRNLDLVFPSTSAYKNWKTFNCENNNNIIISNYLKRDYKITSSIIHKIDNKQKLKIAFVGSASVQKGWNTFEKIAKTFAGQHDFIYFGNSNINNSLIRKIEVVSHNINETKMTNIIRQERIDIAILWSIWPETFCLSACEVAAAGVSIICNRKSGNLAKMVEDNLWGYALDSEESLIELIYDIGNIKLLKPSMYSLEYTNFSLDLIK